MTQDSKSKNRLDLRSRRSGQSLLSNTKGESRKRCRANLVVATLA